jgi:hypothetical protein
MGLGHSLAILPNVCLSHLRDFIKFVGADESTD